MDEYNERLKRMKQIELLYRLKEQVQIGIDLVEADQAVFPAKEELPKDVLLLVGDFEIRARTPKSILFFA